jgi:hypothetical protein
MPNHNGNVFFNIATRHANFVNNNVPVLLNQGMIGFPAKHINGATCAIP